MQVTDQFYTDVLKLIGAPVTTRNLTFLKTWQKFEGGNATNNPLNTTQNAPGATDYNSAHVKNYPDYLTGVTATAKTLTNKYYPYLIQAIRNNYPIENYNTPEILANMRTWGTVNFAAYLNKLQHPTTQPTQATEPKKKG